MRVAVVGAGLAGLVAARDLAAAGLEVVVYEKSRGAGGRTSTRRSPHGRFDHGAPFLHDGDGPLALDAAPALIGYREGPAAGPGVAAPAGGEGRPPRSSTQPRRTWQPPAATISAPSGNATAKALAEGLRLEAGVRVGEIAAVGAAWTLADGKGAELGSFDAVIVTAPAPQAAELLPEPGLAARAASVAFAPCWVAMAAWDQPLEVPFTVARDTVGLAWAVAEAPKPGREPGARWVLQADATLSAELLEEEADTVAAELFTRFGAGLPPPAHLAAHRWRYARPLTPLDDPFVRAGTLFAAGDWCGGTDAGAALRSGRAAAASLLTVA